MGAMPAIGTWRPAHDPAAANGSAGLTQYRQPSAKFCDCEAPANNVAGPDISSEIEARMHNSDFYREQAHHYRQLAAAAENAAAKQEFLELAAACEEVADEIDDCRASG
jgi:hypothetical protein